MKTNLVVADASRTEKTICLAVTPALKSYKISGRARLFEVIAKVNEINRLRLHSAPDGKFSGKSENTDELLKNPGLELSFIAAPPRMAYYMKYSTKIYNIYLKYVSQDDILVYSIDEVFMDITDYVRTGKISPEKFAEKIIRDVYGETGITATAGIGTNMYLAKIAMDIKAKTMTADETGMRIASLDEKSYREELWHHRPLTDFWRIGKGIAGRLEENLIMTMGDVAEISLIPSGRRLLKKLFGINAKLLIDHAWGYEPCTIADAKAYTPENTGLSNGQVLHCPYDFDKARIIIREMTEALVLSLVEKKLVTDQIVLTVGYDIENLTDENTNYKGEITVDFYGRYVPKHAHGTVNFKRHTSSTKTIVNGALRLFDKIVDKELTVRRMTVSANRLRSESEITASAPSDQLDFFSETAEKKEAEANAEKKERRLQETTIKIKNRYGKNAILKGTNLKEGATAIERNRQIGGHKA